MSSEHSLVISDVRYPSPYTQDHNIIARYMMKVNEINVAARPKYAPLLPTDTVVSRDRPPSELVLRLSARLHDLHERIRAIQCELDAEHDVNNRLMLFNKLISKNTEFSLLMYFYLGKIEHEFPSFEYASGFFTIRDHDTVVVTIEAMNWIGNATMMKSFNFAELDAFQRNIVLSPLAE